MKNLHLLFLDAAVVSSGDDSDTEESENLNAMEVPISKASHARFMMRAFISAGIFVKNKVTHVPRSSAAKMADMAGVPESQIRRMGLWNSDTMTNSYLDSLPRQFMRVMAGFNSDTSYYLPRAVEEPPEELKRLVFPWVDHWYNRHLSGSVDQTSGSADSFLQLIKCFKTTLLQDAAVMVDITPNHPIWNHEIFHSPLFLEFKRYAF